MRRLMAAVIAACLALVVASATSLGTFDDVVLSKMEFPKEPCVADSVALLDLLGNPIPLPTSSAFTITGVQVTGLDEAGCAGAQPIVVVDGYPTLVSTDDEVLGLQVFDPLTSTLDQVLSVDLSDPLRSLLDATKVATNVRMTFCPAGRTCT